ncbi:pseudouridylate synthase-like protein 3 [Lojkania enalia]|uniref:Pseudouridylate synthase-like protein 3 n=1 Tax=Lojkania enalia TaxID=147567 RepID=A0A9P4MWC9_9PLEO|nr:pseudouridylate synthase-like protein 3 [Didymosphaeria enalia]
MAGYEKWSQQQLIARISDLEAQLKQHRQDATIGSSVSSSAILEPSATPSPAEAQQPYRKPPKHPPKAFDSSKYSTRLIALKFAYLGQKYNGFEHHKNNTTPLPTIEEELWKALVKTRLISPVRTGDGSNRDYQRIDNKTVQSWDRNGVDVNWEGCEYTKCGRTDRGVSAFGQVIGVRVRSNRPLPKTKPTSPTPNILESGNEDETPFDDLNDELPYIQLLNRVLPPDIRIYAWCPNPPPDFSARFSCKERRYKYFFTNPCFMPVPGSTGLYHPTVSPSMSPMREGQLDIAAMKEACGLLTGLHDFRNFCKIDASKQLGNFKRRIFVADIEEISPLSLPSFLSHATFQNPVTTAQAPKMYAFVLHGSAFLWHQVRSIVAVLFLIGQGLEPPSLVADLLDVSSNPTRPKYEMASDAPLVLWDCIFPHASEVQPSDVRERGYEDRLDWIYAGDEGGMEPKGKSGGGGIGRGKWGRGGIMDDLWEIWRGRKMEETLGALLMDAVAAQGKNKLEEREKECEAKIRGGPRVFDGGDVGRAKGNYIPVLKRERGEPIEVVNERYARKKGLDLNSTRPADEDADE